MMSSFCWQTRTLCICRRKVFSFSSLYLSTVLSFMRKVNFTTANKPSSTLLVLMLMLLPRHCAQQMSITWLTSFTRLSNWLPSSFTKSIYVCLYPRCPGNRTHWIVSLWEGPQGAFTCDQAPSVTIHSISETTASVLCANTSDLNKDQKTKGSSPDQSHLD